MVIHGASNCAKRSPLIRDSVRQLVVCPADVAALDPDWEVIGTFNPGAVRSRDGTWLMIRVAERPTELRPGFTGLPRWQESGRRTVDWTANDSLDMLDPRVVRHKSNRSARLTFTSHLKAFHSSDGISFEAADSSIFAPESPLEEFGVEDPRITPLDGRYYMTYVAVSQHGVVTALASTRDFRDFTRHGVIFGPENKDVVLFPEKIDGQYVAVHRPSGSAGFARPEIWLARSPDLMHWGGHQFLLAGRERWEGERIGAGPPPLRVPGGWLLIYHGAGRPLEPGQTSVYSAGAVLLDLKDPNRILCRGALPILTPETDFERQGFVPHVVFPTGIALDDAGSLLIYYGAADTCCAAVRFSLEEVMRAIGA